MIGQHHAARADPDRGGDGGQVGDQHRRRGAGDAGHIVVFGHPEAGVAEGLGTLGQLGGVGQGGGAGAPSLTIDRSSTDSGISE